MATFSVFRLLALDNNRSHDWYEAFTRTLRTVRHGMKGGPSDADRRKVHGVTGVGRRQPQSSVATNTYTGDNDAGS